MQSSIRLSSSCALYEDDLSLIPTDADESSDRLHMRSSLTNSQKSSAPSEVSSEKKTASPSSLSDLPSEKRSSSASIPSSDQSVEKKAPPPIPQSAIPVDKRSSSSSPPPPPPSQSTSSTREESGLHNSEAAAAEGASNYRPPADFLAEIRQKGAERMARSKEVEVAELSQSMRSVQSTASSRTAPSTRSSDSQSTASNPPSRPLPADFLAEIRQKGAERMARSKEMETAKPSSDAQSSHPPEKPPKPSDSQSTASNPPSRPLPADFLAEIRQKGAERMAKSKEAEVAESTNEPAARSAPSAPSDSAASAETMERPARALPANFLAEIREKGAARQEVLRHTRSRKSSQGTLGSNSSTLGSRSGTIRRNGTLGSNSGSKRYGKFVMHEIRSGQNTLKVGEDGEGSKSRKSGGNPLLDEIRNFNLANLRKVDKAKPSKETEEKKQNQEPSLAELMRSRLECFDSDSNTDSDDSRFDFSD